MLSPRAQRGALALGVVALAFAASAPGCLFAPDRCADLLQCGGGQGGDGGATTGVGGPASSTASGPMLCAAEADCAGGTRPTCDPVTHFCRDCSTEDCRAPLGAACAVDGSCATGRCVAGKCASCSADLQCATELCANAACKAPSGAPCGSNGDCLGGECRFGLCRANIGHACAAPDECFNGVCKAGACTSCLDDVDCPGTACGTGKELGRCLLAPGAGCWPDAQMKVSCFSGACQGFPPTCQ
jgi:hypothetical protein